MTFQEKAKIRIEHWLKHNENHLVDYEQFAQQLEDAGIKAGAGHIREMIEWSAKGNACLRKALKAL